MRDIRFLSIIIIYTIISAQVFAQNLGIGPDTFDPDASAGVEMRFTNKGLLIPRVKLTSVTDATTIPSPATSLLVYNLGTGGLSTPGYYYNAGTSSSPNWVRLATTGLDGSGVATRVAFWTAANTLGSNANLYWDNTNSRLGVGTSSPAEKLHINGSIRGDQSGALRINTGSGYIDIGPKNTSWAHFYTDRSRYWFSTGLTVETGNIGSYDEDLSLQTSGTTRITILNSNGNVGIGTTTPAQKLHVEGTTRISTLANSTGAIVKSDANGDLSKTNLTGSASDVLLGTGAFGNLINSVCYTLPNTGGTAQWVKLGTLTILQQGKSATFKVVSNVGYNATIDQNFEVFIRFKTSNGSSVDANGFAGDASYYVTGRNAQFFTNDRIKFVANAPGTAATAYDLYMYFGAFTGSASFYEVSVSDGTWTHSGTLASDPGPASSTILIPSQEFNIGSGSLVVNLSGNVGIGTTSPGSKLEIRGTADLTLRNDQTLSTSGDDLAVINLGDAYSGSQARILVERGTAGSGGDNPTDISFWNTPDGSVTLTERMRIMHNGNVGIGTTNPANKLHVEGTAQANRLYVGASSFTGGNQTVTDGFEDEGWGYGVPGYAATTTSFTDRIGFRRVGGTFNRAYGDSSHSVSPHSGNYMISSMGYGSTSATSQVDFTFYMGAAGTFSIWYCISSEANYDKAYYYLDDGSEVLLGSGEGSWTQLSLSLAAGFHKISFRYDPDGSKVHRNDALFLDDLSITNVAIGATPADGDIWATGNIVAHTSAHIGDLAEYLPIKGFSKPGMVVSYCKGSDRSFKISDTPYDPYIAGVISTEPSILLNSPDAGYAVGFAGQVPVLVDGDIKGGDYLTSSSKPGYAMKADKAGKVIGFALENKKPDSETVLILIQPGYFVPLPSEEPKEKGLIPVDIDERKMTE